MDDFDFSPEEMELARRVVDRWRVAQKNGVRWSALWPSNGQMFDMPIPLALPAPPSLNETRVECQVIEVMAEAHGKAAPSDSSLPRLEQRDEEESAEEPLPAEGTPIDEAILSVLKESERPIKISTIAQRARLEYGSYIRERVRVLVNKKILKKLPNNRYWLASRPVPS